MNDLKQRTLNGVPYITAAHQHDHITNAGTALTDAYIENVNDTYGTVRMHMQNRTGVNGVLYEQLGTVDLVDFVFKTLSTQSNIRLESRPTSLMNAANTTGEWQIGPAAAPWVYFGASATNITSPVTLGSTLVATGAISGSNVDVDGFSTKQACFRAKMSATQAIPQTTPTKLIFGSVDYDQATSWVAATNRYVAPTAGIYCIQSSIRISAANRACKLMVYKNGVFYCSLDDKMTNAISNSSYNGSTDMQLAATDYVEIFFAANGTCTAQTVDTHVCIRRVD